MSNSSLQYYRNDTVIFLAIKQTSVLGIVPKAKKYVFFQLKQKIPQMNNTFPIFKVEQHMHQEKQLIPRLNLI